MDKNFDYQKILDLVNHISNASDLTVTFSFDQDFYADHEAFFLPASKTTTDFDFSKRHYCRSLGHMLRSFECEKSDEFYKRKAKEEHRPLKYTCHAGLVEVVCPVEINQKVIGYIQCGKFVDKEHKFSSAAKVKETAKKYNLNERELLSLYKELPVVSLKKLNSTLYLLKNFIKPLIVKQIVEEKTATDEKNELLISLKNYVFEHISEPITVEDICKHLFIGKRKLYAIIKSDSDHSIKSFISDVKLTKAQQLLSYTEMPLSQVAEAVGFCDYNYFSRYFKQKMGLSPLAFRSQTNKIIEET